MERPSRPSGPGPQRLGGRGSRSPLEMLLRLGLVENPWLCTEAMGFTYSQGQASSYLITHPC